MTNVDDGSEIITVEDIKRFTRECFLKIGVKPEDCQVMADSIVGADLMGHRSHGIFRLDLFVKDGHRGQLDVKAVPCIVKESAATALVNGNNGLGPVVGNFCMNVAKRKAKTAGAACVAASNSNNLGTVAMYTKQIFAEEKMMALAFTNASPLMVLNRAREPIAGTNPISLAAPGLDGDNFVLDMATTVTSGGNMKIRYLDGEELPKGFALNAACLYETNAEVALKDGRFLPLGSFEDMGSYKGANLSLMVEILCGVLAGAHYLEMVGIWLDRFRKQQANVAHCVIVVNLEFFAPDFEERLSDFLNQVRNVERKDPNTPVLVPGDRARAATKEIEEKGGIPYPRYVISSLRSLSKMLDVEMVKFLPKKREVKKETTSSDEEIEEIVVESEPEAEQVEQNDEISETKTDEETEEENSQIEDIEEVVQNN